MSGLGIFPERQKLLIGLARARRVTRHGPRAAELEMRERPTRPRGRRGGLDIDHLLGFFGRVVTLSQRQQRFTTHPDGGHGPIASALLAQITAAALFAINPRRARHCRDRARLAPGWWAARNSATAVGRKSLLQIVHNRLRAIVFTGKCQRQTGEHHVSGAVDFRASSPLDRAKATSPDSPRSAPKALPDWPAALYRGLAGRFIDPSPQSRDRWNWPNTAFRQSGHPGVNIFKRMDPALFSSCSSAARSCRRKASVNMI